MPNIEIDEVELLRLRKQDQTVNTLLANPKAKKKVFEAYKEQWPNVKIPELEIEEAAKAPITALEKQVADLTKKIEDDAAKREQDTKLGAINGTVEAGKAKLRQAGWTDEGIAAVEKIMQDKGVLDVEMAAAFYEKQHPPAIPSNPRGVGGWDFIGQVNDDEADLKKLIESKGQNDMLADNMARKALNEFRGATSR